MALKLFKRSVSSEKVNPDQSPGLVMCVGVSNSEAVIKTMKKMNFQAHE